MTGGHGVFRKRAVFFLAASVLIFFQGQAENCRAGGGPPEEFQRAEVPFRGFFVGETLVYGIRCLGVSLGTARAEVREITRVRGRTAYHIVVRVRSSRAVDLVFKVRDVHHSFIDAGNLGSLGYRKILNQGFSHSAETALFYPERGTARYQRRRAGPWETAAVPGDVQDPLSCGYFFRTLPAVPGDKVVIPVFADGKVQDVEVAVRERTERFEIKGVGRFEALETLPRVPFQGIFVKEGKIRGWIGTDARRIPLEMKMKVPWVGTVTARLREYQPGRHLGGGPAE